MEISASDPAPLSEEDIDEDQEALKRNLMVEFERVLALGQLNTPPRKVCNSSMRRLTCRLKNVKNANQAISTILALSSKAGSSVRRGGRIGVNSTGYCRRREGVPKGSKKIPAGRPPKKSDQKSKRAHNLTQSVRENRSHPKAHGH